jgi:FtsZ-interacting cell division protein ZipA
MDGTVIAIIVIAAIILIALLVALPRMRRASAERKQEQERREHEKRVERERMERAEEHRSVAQKEHSRAELAEAEAQRARAEADINAKRAELHEKGLADDELESGRQGFRDDDRGADEGFRRVEGGRAHEPVADSDTHDTRVARGDSTGSRDEFERGREVGHEEVGGDRNGRFTRVENDGAVEEDRPRR